MSARRQSPPLVMLVDDDPDTLTFLTDFLHSEGFRVSAWTDWSDAERTLADEVPALLVLDVMMPAVSGYRAAERLRRQCGRSVPVLMYSALSRDDAVVQGFASGTNAYLCKPASLEQLRAVIAHLLAESRELQRSA
jgi:two-component system, sensor histidine kinase ChiS